MFERYTEQARRVLFFARYEASQLGSLSIEADHLLLGLIRESKGIISRVFAGGRRSLEEVRVEIEKGTTFRERVATSVEMPFSPATKRVLQFAAQEADGLQHRHIGTEHLLLGILREEQSNAAKILKRQGLSIESARQDIVALLAGSPFHSAEQSVAGLLAIRVSPADTQAGPEFSAGPTWWRAEGFTLKRLIAQLYGIDEFRIPRLPGEEQRFECSVVVPRAGADEEMKKIVHEAIERFFDITLTVEQGPDGARVSVVPAR